MAVLVPSKGLKHYKTLGFLRFRGPGRAEAPGQEGVGGGKPTPVLVLERRGSADLVHLGSLSQTGTRLEGPLYVWESWLDRAEGPLYVHKSRPDRAEGPLYVRESWPDRAEGPLYVHKSRPDRAEGPLHVQESKPDRAEGPLYVQRTRLTVQRVLCTSWLTGLTVQRKCRSAPQSWYPIYLF